MNTFETNLLNFAKKVKAGIEEAGDDALKLASFLSTNSAEVTGLASLAGPAGASVSATATTVLGLVTTAVKSAGDAASQNGLSVSFDAETIAAVKAVIAAIEKI